MYVIRIYIAGSNLLQASLLICSDFFFKSEMVSCRRIRLFSVSQLTRKRVSYKRFSWRLFSTYQVYPPGEAPFESRGKSGEISNDRIADAAVDGAGEMQGRPLGLDGKKQRERGLPPVFGAAPAGGTLGVAGAGGNAEGSGGTSEGAQGVGNERGLSLESSRETAGSQDVAERKEASQEEGGESGAQTAKIVEFANGLSTSAF